MVETKASRLQALSAIVPVPKFVVIGREDARHVDLDASCRYMVRSASRLEDQQEFSQAGQFPTSGPMEREQVPASIQQTLLNDDVDTVIVQEYVEAEQWGVAFCFSAERMLVEYAAEFEGVTSGTVNPFTALLPTSLPRYQQLESRLQSIYARFGPCDVEFVNLANPQFVQVRPITRTIAFDHDFVELKTQLQELQSASWRENDVCRVLAERDNKSRALSELYLQAIEEVYATRLKRKIALPPRPFIKVSEQYFMDRGLEAQIAPKLREVLRLGFRMSGILDAVSKEDLTSSSAFELMQKSILVSLAYDLFKKKEAMKLREEIRIALDQKLAEGSLEADFHYPKILDSSIEFDSDKSIWKSLSIRDEEGITVVEGNLEHGPYFVLTSRDQEIPAGVIVITEHLYPEIGKSITDIRGIICKYGALGAHVAILAREHQVALRIQTSIEEYLQ